VSVISIEFVIEKFPLASNADCHYHLSGFYCANILRISHQGPLSEAIPCRARDAGTSYKLQVYSPVKLTPFCYSQFATVQFASAITSGVQLKLAKNFSHFINKQSLIVIGVSSNVLPSLSIFSHQTFEVLAREQRSM
jgi:hypothetical protein